MRLESGPAASDRNYFLLFFLFCAVMALWFFKDGTHWPAYGAAGGWLKGYINHNREEARRKLSPLVGEDKVPAELGSTPSRQQFEAMKRGSPPPTREQIIAAWGQPIHTAADARGDTTDIFATDFGKVMVVSREGVVDPARMERTVWYKDDDEVRAQYYWAVLPLVLAFYAGFRMYRAATLRCEIDDEGMTYGGRRIAFADMTGLDNYSLKGWVDLVYREGDQERKLRIDDHKILRFNEILDALCERKGFQDPRALTKKDAS